MRVFATNPVGGELLMLTNPRRKRKPIRRNTDVWNEWEKEYEDAPVVDRREPVVALESSEADAKYNARMQEKYKRKYGKKKGAKKVAKRKTHKRKKSTWMSLVKKFGVKAAKKVYRKTKAGKKVSRRRKVRRTSTRVTMPKRSGKRRVRISISAARPAVIKANPRKRKYHRKVRKIVLNPVKRHYRKHARRHIRRNPHMRSLATMRSKKIDAMAIAMIIVGFGTHRLLLKGTDALVKKIPIDFVQKYSTDVANILIPITGYYLFNKVKVTSKFVNKIPYVGKYKAQVLVGAYASAGMILLKRVLPSSVGKFIPFGDGNNGITLVPNMSGYVEGAVDNGVLGGYIEGDNGVLGGYVNDNELDLGGDDEFILG